MNSSGGAFFALFLYLQIVASLALLVGVVYALYCLNRMSQNIERIADAAQFLMDKSVAQAHEEAAKTFASNAPSVSASAPQPSASAPQTAAPVAAPASAVPEVASAPPVAQNPSRNDESNF